MSDTQSKTATFTPGPWRVDSADPYIVTADIDGLLVAETDNADREDDSVCESNARIIAAAPELLSVAKAAVAWLNAIEKRLGTEMVDLMPNGSLGRPAMLQAIAKAEGR